MARPFAGVSKFPGPSGGSQPGPSSIPASRASLKGLGLGGKGLGKTGKRHKKVLRDAVHGVTKGDIRRLARRGGVKRISAMVYDEIRVALKKRLDRILFQAIAVVESSGRMTVTARDVVFVLNRLGTTLYGYDDQQPRR
ncbi:histone-fold-containing protein [Sporormia fimetaria CBS 119925]|uniref:Histone H4 n=1 Tax=Sporormia fimetaria CBS 119925 TaxID=1340428 RepID=A0A6A6V372_9PLEO|nr:histone-fold-containing protein [Sporormia fimetaria CBS 119925]